MIRHVLPEILVFGQLGEGRKHLHNRGALTVKNSVTVIPGVIY
jgi:hypothetical protein